ncbi:MAG: GNAT family N-acetyltransferase [Synechococcales bacterium]|nr:GNAT family N-acetyltransferase [Synechococcales bacterium]
MAIHNANVLNRNTSNPRGFLLAQTSAAEITENLGKAHQYFVALSCNNEPVAFLTLARPRVSDAFLNQILWQDASCRDKILSDRHLYVKTVAARPDHTGRGIARFLYGAMFARFPQACFSAFIVTKPLRNGRSLTFHQKQGFQQVGIFRQDFFLDLQGYESVLVFKEL